MSTLRAPSGQDVCTRRQEEWAGERTVKFWVPTEERADTFEVSARADTSLFQLQNLLNQRAIGFSRSEGDVRRIQSTFISRQVALQIEVGEKYFASGIS